MILTQVSMQDKVAVEVRDALAIVVAEGKSSPLILSPKMIYLVIKAEYLVPRPQPPCLHLNLASKEDNFL